MNTAYGILLAIATSLGMGFLQPSSSSTDSNDPPENCQCKVVNKSDYYPKPAPTCTDPGGGGSVPAYTVSNSTYPSGESPKGGVCTAGTCETQTAAPCTYATQIVSVTISPCALALWGYSSGEKVKVEGERSNPQPWTSPIEPFEQGAETFTWQCEPPTQAGKDACGTKEMTATMKALKADGTTAFTVVFSFGCGRCKSASV